MKLKLQKRSQVLEPKPTNIGMSTLWEAKLQCGASTQEFLFRQKDDWEAAATTAQDLVDKSPACVMVGAVIIGVRRVAHLWN